MYISAEIQKIKMNTQVDDIVSSDVAEEDYWTPAMLKLLISTRLNLDNAFIAGKKSKTKLWRIVHSEIIKNDVEFPFSVEETKTKFNNLMTTYKRIKKRNSATGKVRTYWPYFEAFDVVLGRKYVVTASTDTILDSSNENNNKNIIEKELEELTDQSPVKKPKTNFQEVLNFLKIMEDNDEKRYQEQMILEKQKLDVEIKKLELLQEIIYKIE